MADKRLMLQLEARRVPDDAAGRLKMIEDDAGVIRRLANERNDLLGHLQRVARASDLLLRYLHEQVLESSACEESRAALEAVLTAAATAGYIDRS